MPQEDYPENARLQKLLLSLESSTSVAKQLRDKLSVHPEILEKNPLLHKKIQDGLPGRWEKVHELLSISRNLTGAERQQLIMQIQQYCQVCNEIEALLKKWKPEKAAPALVKMGAFSHSLQPDFFAVESRYKLSF